MAQSSGDIITDFVAWTGDESSPEIFRRWTAISMVAAAAERRLWVRTGPKLTFLNLYTILVGAPGTGKGIIDKGKPLLRKVCLPGTEEPAFWIGADSMTPASLVDEIFDSRRTFFAKDANVVSSPVYAMAEEMSVLMPVYDMAFVGMLNSIWNCPWGMHRQRRRSGKPPNIELENAVLNVLAGAQPMYIASTFPEDTWSTGLSRRCIMVFDDSPKGENKNPFLLTDGLEHLEPPLISQFQKLSQMYGQIEWSREAMDEFIEWWVERGGKPVPTHSKLIGYKTNRQMNMFKLAGISVASRGDENLFILPIDFQRARYWLLEVEALMPDVFRAMVGRSDFHVLEELHIWMVAQWQAKGHGSVPKVLMMAFLAGIVPGNKALEIISQAEGAGYIRRDKEKEGDWYFPAAKITRMPE